VLPRIENWSVSQQNANPYQPPEASYLVVCGSIYGHPKHKDGRVIKTSAVVAAKGRRIWTEHTVYDLGRISPKYRQWLHKNRPNWDWRNPITVPLPSKEMELSVDKEPLL